MRVQTGHEAARWAREGERHAQVLEAKYGNEHRWPEQRNDDERRRGVTTCRQCERTLVIDAKPAFRQHKPCSVLRG